MPGKAYRPMEIETGSWKRRLHVCAHMLYGARLAGPRLLPALYAAVAGTRRLPWLLWLPCRLVVVAVLRTSVVARVRRRLPMRVCVRLLVCVRVCARVCSCVLMWVVQDLLYGSGRQALSDKYFGIGDKYVPLDKVSTPPLTRRTRPLYKRHTAACRRRRGPPMFGHLLAAPLPACARAVAQAVQGRPFYQTTGHYTRPAFRSPSAVQGRPGPRARFAVLLACALCGAPRGACIRVRVCPV